MAIDLSDALKAARLLLGWKLVHTTAAGTASGYIVETEAYTMDDPASHSFRGQTLRNSAMFGKPGTVYVYFTYGMHYCVNIVTGQQGEGQAVLIRALEPVDGINLMKNRRSTSDAGQLTNGPAKLTQALGIDATSNNLPINQGPIRLEPGFVPEEVLISARIGIKTGADNLWRFYIANNPFVSRKNVYNAFK